MSVPTCFTGRAGVRVQIRADTERDGVVAWVLLHDIPRFAHRDAESSPLADREVLMSIVLGQFVALAINDATLGKPGWISSLKKTCVVIIGNETDFLRIGLGMDPEAEAGRLLSHRFLRQLADWQHHLVELPWANTRDAASAEEHIGLVFVLIDRALESGVSRGCVDSGVVAARDPRGIYSCRIVVKPAEFEPVIAPYAWIGSSSGVILAFEVLDDPLKVVSEIEWIERDIECCSYAAGIVGVGNRAAAFVPKRGACHGLPWCSEPHEASNDVKASLDQHGGCNAGVDATGHGDEHTVSSLRLHVGDDRRGLVS